MPNDDAEQIREGIKHRLYVDYIFDGKLILAPIGSNPQKIVDLGTGVGFWAQDGVFTAARVTSHLEHMTDGLASGGAVS
jgi:hypothetical protein